MKPILLVFSALALMNGHKVIDLKKTTLSKKEMLVSHTWQVTEVARSIDGVNTQYVKDEVNTTGTDYSLLRITFNDDGTGTYTDETGTTHTTNWSFTTSDEHNLQLQVGPPYAQTWNWRMVEITEESLYNTTAVGESILVTARYIPVNTSLTSHP